MTTTVAKTIGTGGDYTILQSWEDASPADLTSVDQIWQGRVKNQEFVSSSTLLTISGTVVDATRYTELTTDVNASFVDNANRATNALAYNALNGAAINLTGTYAVGIQVSQQYTRINKLQVRSSSTGAGSSAAINVSTANGINCDINQCIIQSYSSSASLGTVAMSGAGNTLRNSLVVQRRSSAAAIIAFLGNGAAAYNSTFVSTNTTLNSGIGSAYNTGVLTNCYIGNVTAPTSGSTVFTKTNCYTSATATGYTTAPFSTATFASITDGSFDFRLVTGSALINAGATDSTHALADIIGKTRPIGGAYDVGAWEFDTGTTIPASIGAGTASGSTATIVVPLVITCVVGAGTANGLDANVSNINGNVVNGLVGAGTAAGATATVSAMGVLTTSPLINNTGSILTNQNVAWTWFPGGRIGALHLISSTDGSGITDQNGVLTLTGLPHGVGILMIAVLVTNATDDLVYYESQVVA